jgi:hypothetical protein
MGWYFVCPMEETGWMKLPQSKVYYNKILSWLVSLALYTMWFDKWMKSTNLNKSLIKSKKALVFCLGEQINTAWILKSKALIPSVIFWDSVLVTQI